MRFERVLLVLNDSIVSLCKLLVRPGGCYLRVPRTFRKIKNKSTVTTGIDAMSSKKTFWLTPPATALIPPVLTLVIELIAAINRPRPVMTKVETTAAIKHTDVCFDMIVPYINLTETLQGRFPRARQSKLPVIAQPLFVGQR